MKHVILPLIVSLTLIGNLKAQKQAYQAGEIQFNEGEIINVIVNPLQATGGIDFIDLEWSGAHDIYEDITGFVLDWSPDDVTYQFLDDFPPETTEFTHEDLALETTYYYQLTINRDSEEPVMFVRQTSTLPTPPSNLGLTINSPIEIQLDWQDNSSIEFGFTIQRSLAGSEDFQDIDFVSSDVETYTDRSASPNTSYLYRVQAVGISGNTTSNTAEGTTPDSNVIYVDSEAFDGNADGTSWLDAFLTLGEALNDEGTSDGDRIWVANREGGYSPGSTPGDTYTIDVLLGLQILGGFEGEETDPSQRPEEARTLLEGDIGTGGDPSDNINRMISVLTGINTTLIDGFIITNTNGGFGTGIFTNTNLIVSNCEFSNNMANDGAGIFAQDGDGIIIDLTVNNSVFSNNSVNNDGTAEGGAIHFISDGTLSISNSQFSSNFSDGSGGAVYFSSSGNLKISGSTFTNNTASNNVGGAIYQYNGSSTIDGNTTFDNNDASYGGAVYVTAGRGGIANLSVSNGIFSENDGTGGAGAIGFESEGLLTITETQFDDNFAGAEVGGGAILVRGFSPDLSISNGTFNLNISDNDGGAILFESNGDFDISESTFTSNSAANSSGGAIYQYNGNTNIENTSFDQNEAAVGGGIYVAAGGGSEAYLTIVEGMFNANTVLDSDGGGIYFNSTGTLSITDSEFEGNSAPFNFGGALYVYDAGVEIGNVTFTGNSALAAGGAIYASTGTVSIDPEMNIINSVFNNNDVNTSTVPSSGSGGGAVYADDYTLDIDNCEFEGNSATNIGGAIYHSNGDISINDSFISGNSANAGGGIAFSSKEIFISNTTISSNDANNRGGGIAIRNNSVLNELQIVNTTISSNIAGTSGGGVHFGDSNDGIGTFSHVTIFDNTSSGVGGGLSVTDDITATINLSNTIIAGNSGLNNTNDIGLVNDEGPLTVQITSLGYNLIGDVGDFIFDTNTTGDQYGDPQGTTTPNEGASESATAIDPMLEELSENFAEIPTNALLSGSPAIDAGSIVVINEDEILNDQRGFPYVDAPDIGAFEFYLTFPPDLDNSGDLSLTAINEDDSNNNGDLLTDIGEGSELIEDEDGPALGVAIFEVDEIAGNWQYSLDNGETWNDTGSPALTAALLLPIDGQTRVRLQPTANFNGTVENGFKFKAWDQAAGTAGGTLDVSEPGLDSPFSEESETVSIIVNPVNDAPTLVSQDLALSAIEEDGTNNEGDLLKNLGDPETGLLNDVDGPGTGIAITGVDNNNGSWQFSLNNGSTWSDLGSPGEADALLLPLNEQARIRFRPNDNFNGTISSGLTFKAWDQSGGSEGGTLDVSSFDATSPFSQETESMSIFVEAVNDAPTVINPIEDLEIPLGRFNFTFDDNVFNDVEDGNDLTYSTEELPDWLTFDGETRSFTGSLPSGTSGLHEIAVIATDSEEATGVDVFAILINPLLSVEDELSQAVSLYPIPSRANLNLEINNTYIGKLDLRVLDLSGRNVLSKSFVKSETSFVTKLDLKNLNPGTYLIEIIAGEDRVLQRVIRN